MTAQTAKQVQKFPFDRLPKVDLADQARFHELEKYYGIMNRSTVLNDLSGILREMLGVPCEVHLSQVQNLTGEEIHQGLPAEFLLMLVGVEPQGKKGYLLFDLPLAHFLSHAALGGDPSGLSLAQTEVKPVTPLSEAVVSYVLVSLLDMLSPQIQDRQIEFRVDRFLREQKSFAAEVSGRERFVVFSLMVATCGQKFPVKLGLPSDLVVGFSDSVTHEGHGVQRLRDFDDFRVPFVLDVGGLDLAPEELAGLEVGDIVLFEESQVVRKSGGWEGLGLIRVLGSDEDQPGLAVSFNHGAKGLVVMIT